VKKLNILIFVMLGMWLLACSPAGEVRRLGQEIRSRIPSNSEQTPSPSDAQDTDATTEAAVKLVIQRANLEQEQAIAAKDPKLMRDSATDRYYQEMVDINQSLLDAGVTRIRMVSIEWGTVTVSGDSASATTFETWSTTYSDGRNDRSRDRNLYRLVLREGSWKIDSDEHPEQREQQPRGLPQV